MRAHVSAHDKHMKLVGLAYAKLPVYMHILPAVASGVLDRRRIIQIEIAY